MTYQELKKKLQDRYNKFLEENGFFAFGREQFEEGKKKINIPNNEDIISIGMGGYIKKTAIEEYKKMIVETTDEELEWLKDHENLKQAIWYELGNHEYQYTEEIDDTLDALALPEEYWKDPKNLELLNAVIKEFMKKNGY
jgi:hypothetical protein